VRWEKAGGFSWRGETCAGHLFKGLKDGLAARQDCSMRKCHGFGFRALGRGNCSPDADKEQRWSRPCHTLADARPGLGLGMQCTSGSAIRCYECGRMKSGQKGPRSHSLAKALAGIQPYVVHRHSRRTDFDSNNDSAICLFFELTRQKTCLSSSESFTNVSSIEPSRLPRRMDLRSAD
jgi:hypothetical protein